jgi:hypothetical protein
MPTTIQDGPLPFKSLADRRHHIPKQRHRVTNWAAYDAGLRGRGRLTMVHRGRDCALARGAADHPWRAAALREFGNNETALTLWAVFRLALRQTEGLIGSIIALLGLDLAIPDHSTLSRRAEILALPRRQPDTAPVHLLVDSTGLRLCGPGEWLVKKHGSKRRRAWRKLHIGTDANTGQIVAAELTSHDIDDGSQVGPLLEQVTRPVASFTGDGAYDRDDVYSEVSERHPDAAVIVPSRWWGCRVQRPRPRQRRAIGVFS